MFQESDQQVAESPGSPAGLFLREKLPHTGAAHEEIERYIAELPQSIQARVQYALSKAAEASAQVNPAEFAEEYAITIFPDDVTQAHHFVTQRPDGTYMINNGHLIDWISVHLITPQDELYKTPMARHDADGNPDTGTESVYAYVPLEEILETSLVMDRLGFVIESHQGQTRIVRALEASGESTSFTRFALRNVSAQVGQDILSAQVSVLRSLVRTQHSPSDQKEARQKAAEMAVLRMQIFHSQVSILNMLRQSSVADTAVTAFNQRHPEVRRRVGYIDDITSRTAQNVYSGNLFGLMQLLRDLPDGLRQFGYYYCRPDYFQQEGIDPFELYQQGQEIPFPAVHHEL